MTMMKQAVVVFGVAALGVVQSGCTDPCDSPGNGKKQELSFGVPQEAAQGMQTKVQLYRGPMAMIEGLFPTRDPMSCYGYDSTDVEVALPDSLQSAPAVIDRSAQIDITAEFTCGAQTQDAQQVTVRLVTMEGEVRRSDAFDIACHPIAQASVDLVPGPRGLLGGDRFVVGGLVHLKPTMLDADGNTLSGFGVVPADELLVAQPRDRFAWKEVFRVAAAGELPELMVGSQRVQLDATFVPDSSWALVVEKQPTGSQGFLRFSASPKTISSGEMVNGMEECEWTAHTASESRTLDVAECDFEHSSALPGSNRAISRMCVKTLGREGCVDVR